MPDYEQGWEDGQKQGNAELAKLKAALEEVIAKCKRGESHTWIEQIARKALANEQSTTDPKATTVCPGCGRTYYINGPQDRDHSLCRR